jgi:hypothetical protein
MAQTTRYGFALLQAGQAQKEITHNDALARIDSLIHLAVESRHATTAADVIGTSWIIAAGATGEWAGHDGEIAVCDESGWSFVAPLDGCIAFLRDEGLFVHYAAGQWHDAWVVQSLVVGGLTLSGGAATVVPDPSGGTVIDVEARAALSQLLTTLRTTGLVAAA